MALNRTAFFEAVRGSLFGGRLTQPQVDGMNALLDAGQRYGVTDRHHMANVLAQVFHETGGYMLPIKETVMPSHKDKNPSDATVIGRLDRAFAAGQLSWVKTPYWRSGWFGRGPIQITHEENYRKLGKRIGVDLVKSRNLALDRNIGASIAVVGMKEGLFTGRKLADYSFPAALDAPVKSNPRRIVNGKDGTDAKIAGYHRDFHAGLVAAGWPEKATQPQRPMPAPEVPADDQPRLSGLAVAVILTVVALAIIGFIFAQ